MTVAARELQTWIGVDVVDSAGEKLGKLEDVYFHGDEPLVAGIRSGMAGRKHHAVTLSGATVTRDCLAVAVSAEQIVATDSGGVGADELAALAAADDRLRGLEPADLEGWGAREERLKALAEAQAKAEALEAEALRRGDEEAAAAERARRADQEAEDARAARLDAEQRARQAREDADER